MLDPYLTHDLAAPHEGPTCPDCGGRGPYTEDFVRYDCPDCHPIVEFTYGQVEALCGTFPHANGFHWPSVGHFMLEDGILQPYDGDEILPGPGLAVEVVEAPDWISERIEGETQPCPCEESPDVA